MQCDSPTETSKELIATSEAAHWMDEVVRLMGSEQNLTASRAFSAVLQALRAHLPNKEADSLGSQLPAFAQDVYYDRSRADAWHTNSVESFTSSVASACPELSGEQVERAIWSALTILSHHVSPEVIREVRPLLPSPIQALWNTSA